MHKRTVRDADMKFGRYKSGGDQFPASVLKASGWLPKGKRGGKHSLGHQPKKPRNR